MTKKTGCGRILPGEAKAAQPGASFYLEGLVLLYPKNKAEIFRKYAVPQMIGLVVNSAYFIVDGIFIGNRLGRDAMAAAAVSVPLLEILIAISLAVSSGAGVIISSGLGRKQFAHARRTFTRASALMLAIGVLITVLGNVFIHQLAELLGSTPDIHSQAVKYMWYIVTFSPFLLFSFLLSSFLRNDNQPKLAMFALTFGSISNIVLDYVFMYPLNMGIAGAALATALGPIFSVIIMLPHFLKKKGYLYLVPYRVETPRTFTILKLGFPAFIMEFSIGLITFLYNTAVIRNGYGEIGLAAYLIIGYIMLLYLTVFLGLAQGLQPIFSYYCGTGEQEQGRKLLIYSIKLFALIGVVCYVVILIGGKSFIGFFTPQDPELASFTLAKTRVYFTGFVFAGLNILLITYWQAVQRTSRSLLISLMRSTLAPLPLLIILPVIFGRESIWTCHSLGELVTFGTALLLIYSTKSRLKSQTPIKQNT